MKIKFIIFITLLILFPAVSNAEIALLQVEGPIDPIVARYIDNGIKKASYNPDVSVIIIEMNTPGGLVNSMETIVRSITNSSIPVCLYVYPKTARAASAGTFIAMACDIIAMAPQTHIGAAHPVTMGSSPEKSKTKYFEEWLKLTKSDTEALEKLKQLKPDEKSSQEAMMEKITNYLVAKIKSFARAHNRNDTWAEQAVRKSVMIDEEEAKKINVIEIIADDLNDLIIKLDNYKLKKSGKDIVLNLKNKNIINIKMGFSEYFLHSIANPQVAYFLLILGFLGIFFEFKSPGIGFPGVFGGICMILSFVSLQMLPINLAGILLICLGIILFILEVKVVSYGILSIGGIISFIFGSMIMIDSPSGATYYSIPAGMIAGVTTGVAICVLAICYLAAKSFKVKVSTGKEGIVGEIGIVKEKLDPKGFILVEGELWKAKCADGTEVDKDTEVIVKQIKGRLLIVEIKKD